MTVEHFKQLAAAVQTFLAGESSGHDFYHAERVFNIAMHIRQSEGGDPEIIGAAALVHDACRPWEKETGKSHFGEEALAIIREILEGAVFDPAKLPAVLDIVRHHDICDWSAKMDKSIELQVLQDADNLDAIGAIGIARAFTFGGAHGLAMYVPGENLDFTEDFVDDVNNRNSAVAHFYEKLLKLADNMNTPTGKKLAEQRQAVMERFLQEFFDEWHGKR